jgi:acyl-lipid omega-6 desaturase (Delta-12 desaturase)
MSRSPWVPRKRTNNGTARSDPPFIEVPGTHLNIRFPMPVDQEPLQPAPPSQSTSWKALVAPYQKPSVRRSVGQVVSTLVPYAALWFLMVQTITISYWLTLPLAILAAGFLIRNFILFHDCGHGSFFKSRNANHALGFITGVLTFTPYHHWRWEHAMHHSTAGDLDRRGQGDVWTMTVREYLSASRGKRIAYRLARNPFVLFVLAPLFLFLVLQRFPSRKAPRRERHSVYWTNLAVLGMAVALGLTIGFKNYLLIQLTVMLVAGAAGVWLFYVQHQFEGVYWARHDEWDYATVALQGSSFYKLPKVLQWFTGNIGFHHIHHLRPGIPNYNLERCHQAVPLFQSVKPVTLLSSLRSLSFRLWDEQRQQLVGYHHLRTCGLQSVVDPKPSEQ